MRGARIRNGRKEFIQAQERLVLEELVTLITEGRVRDNAESLSTMFPRYHQDTENASEPLQLSGLSDRGTRGIVAFSTSEGARRAANKGEMRRTQQGRMFPTQVCEKERKYAYRY
jgi:hypothetical protein